MSERSAIVTPLRETLESLGCLVFRMNSGSPKRRMRGHKAGTPDLLVFPPLFPVFWKAAVIEAKGSHKDACKCPSCVAQREMRIDFVRREVLYLFVRSKDEALLGLGLAPLLPSNPRPDSGVSG